MDFVTSEELNGYLVLIFFMLNPYPQKNLKVH